MELWVLEEEGRGEQHFNETVTKNKMEREGKKRYIRFLLFGRSSNKTVEIHQAVESMDQWVSGVAGGPQLCCQGRRVND